jgi:hypothetical protein
MEEERKRPNGRRTLEGMMDALYVYVHTKSHLINVEFS